MGIGIVTIVMAMVKVNIRDVTVRGLTMEGMVIANNGWLLLINSYKIC